MKNSWHHMWILIWTKWIDLFICWDFKFIWKFMTSISTCMQDSFILIQLVINLYLYIDINLWQTSHFSKSIYFYQLKLITILVCIYILVYGYAAIKINIFQLIKINWNVTSTTIRLYVCVLSGRLCYLHLLVSIYVM